MSEISDTKALVLFSGGQDSATCLAWALKKFSSVETLGFDYGQRHHIELDVRQVFRQNIQDAFPQWKEKLGQDHLLNARVLGELGETAMTKDIAIEIDKNNLPTTFVPGRNLLFFTLAGALAYRRGVRHLIGGMCETDYSGYPDCRDDTLKSQQVSLSLGLGKSTVIHTPLMWKTKAQTFQLAYDLGGTKLVELVLEYTHTCYLGVRETRHKWGYGCGECPACELRKNGWIEYCGL